jgi:hypothetical protein
MHIPSNEVPLVFIPFRDKLLEEVFSHLRPSKSDEHALSGLLAKRSSNVSAARLNAQSVIFLPDANRLRALRPPNKTSAFEDLACLSLHSPFARAGDKSARPFDLRYP